MMESWRNVLGTGMPASGAGAPPCLCDPSSQEFCPFEPRGVLPGWVRAADFPDQEPARGAARNLGGAGRDTPRQTFPGVSCGAGQERPLTRTATFPKFSGQLSRKERFASFSVVSLFQM